jgi:alpha-L-fucosidase
MAANGDSIYGTRGGPITPRSWGVTTQKGDTVYVHVLDWADPVLALPALPRRVKAARLLQDGRPVAVQQTPAGVTLPLPEGGRDPYDTVVVVELAPR